MVKSQVNSRGALIALRDAAKANIGILVTIPIFPKVHLSNYGKHALRIIVLPVVSSAFRFFLHLFFNLTVQVLLRF